jgi:hypothetical protein
MIELDKLRADGWVVAVHNDYRQNGEAHTFWLLTKGNRFIKGEGRTDPEALAQAYGSIQGLTDLERRSLEALSTLKAHVGRNLKDDELCGDCEQVIDKLIEDLQDEALKE